MFIIAISLLVSELLTKNNRKNIIFDIFFRSRNSISNNSLKASGGIAIQSGRIAYLFHRIRFHVFCKTLQKSNGGKIECTKLKKCCGSQLDLKP